MTLISSRHREAAISLPSMIYDRPPSPRWRGGVGEAGQRAGEFGLVARWREMRPPNDTEPATRLLSLGLSCPCKCSPAPPDLKPFLQLHSRASPFAPTSHEQRKREQDGNQIYHLAAGTLIWPRPRASAARAKAIQLRVARPQATH